MKKKVIFSGMILLALVLTTGTFGYTYAGYSGTTLEATLADAAMTTYEPSAEQPDWESILPNGEYKSEILIPNAAGDDTELPVQFPDSGEHWDKVDERPADNITTYVSTLSSAQWERDLYNLANFIEATGSENINGVTVYFNFAAEGNHEASAMAEIKTNGEVFSGPTELQQGSEFITKSYQWIYNPVTGQQWTWEEINNLQAGVTMRGVSRNRAALCTQVYVAVSYEASVTEGELPEGDLFDITPHPDYTGDMQVRIYLTNTAELIKAYRYLHMEIYVKNSLEAAKTPRYQILSIENGVAVFNIEGGAAEEYVVEVWGGSYRLTSGDPDEWGAGWSITPEFYCEVTQR